MWEYYLDFWWIVQETCSYMFLYESFYYLAIDRSWKELKKQKKKSNITNFDEIPT